jgi:MOSC domain-containing protein YiiM
VRGSILQINISPGGLPKRPVHSGEVTPLGITGDLHSNPQVHGGPRQALLLVTSEGIEELKQQGFPLYFGALGENLTTVGLDRRAMRIGQRYRVGEIVIELTKVRGPCSNLNVYTPQIQKAVYDPEVKAGDWGSPRWGLSGFYARVLQPGVIRSGDPVVLLEQAA